MAYKLIIFDVDGTLVEQTSSWVIVHKHYDVGDLALSNLREYESGKIDYPTFMRKDISLWKHPIYENDIKKILNNFEIKPEVELVIETLKKRNYKIALVSAGIDILVKKLNAIFKVDTCVANGLEVDKTGLLTGNGIFRVDLLNKHKALPKILDSINCTREETVAVGDSRFDKTMLDFVGCGISIGNHKELKDVSDYRINSLSELLDLI